MCGLVCTEVSAVLEYPYDGSSAALHSSRAVTEIQSREFVLIDASNVDHAFAFMHWPGIISTDASVRSPVNKCTAFVAFGYITSSHCDTVSNIVVLWMMWVVRRWIILNRRHILIVERGQILCPVVIFFDSICYGLQVSTS